MTLGTVVVEAAEGSGTRWTVQQALEQDREVFCVPGSIFSPASRFTNRMIKEGAKLVADYTDILEELNLPDIGELGLSCGKHEEAPVASASAEDSGVEELDGLDEGEGALLALVSDQPVHVDDLCRQSGIPIASISSMLTLLELKGRVTQVGSMHYVRASALGVTHGS